jgi:PAS domain S-box-containing protein
MDSQLFLQFASALPEPMWLLYANGEIVAANRAACEMCELAAASISGARLSDLVADSSEHVAAFLRNCSRTREVTLGSLGWRTADGRTVDCRCEGMLLRPRSGDSPALVILRCRPKEVTTSRFLALNEKIEALAREITERNRAEAALFSEREWFRTTLHSIADAVIVTGPQSEIRFMNPAAGGLTGWKPEEAIGQPIDAVFRIVSEDTRTPLENPAGKVIRENISATLTGDPILVSRDGSERSVDDSAAPIRDEHGEIIGVVLVFRDVTERNKAEEQLRQTQKLESLGLLAGGLAHDFNNLLTGILGNASLALESAAPGNPTREMLQEVMRASQRAADLTRQMLAYAGKGRFVIEQVDLSELIREIIALVQTSIPKTVQLRLELKIDLPVVDADASQLQQVVMNLVINAAEAIEEGQSGLVAVTTGVRTLDEDFIARAFGPGDITPGEYVFLQISDTGCGMDEATRGKIFDPFFTTKFAGRGLGLAATLGIVRSHRGAVRVLSAPHQGSTFEVYLPVSANQIVAPAEAAQRAELSGSGVILIVDDEEVVRRTAKLALERYGYTVLAAENGMEGLEVLGSTGGPVSLVLLDMTMPVMSGEETLEHMRRLRPDLKVVLSSGYNEVEAIRRFSGKGLAGFLQKPYTSAQLAEKVKTILEAGRRPPDDSPNSLGSACSG